MKTSYKQLILIPAIAVLGVTYGGGLCTGCAPAPTGGTDSDASVSDARGDDGGGATSMAAMPESHVMSKSAYEFNDTVAIIEGAIAEENMMVVHQIDAQKMLRMVEVQTGGMKQILFFHPRYLKKIRETDMNAAIEAPMKILVMEKPNGDVMLRYVSPVHTFSQYDGLEDVGKELQEAMERIVSEATS